MPDTCLVIFHSPGPAWEPGLPLVQQTGVAAHRAHFAQLLEQGLLLRGGPFVDAPGGGMMVCRPGADLSLLQAHAQADPAVASGLLVFEIRPWLVALTAPVTARG